MFQVVPMVISKNLLILIYLDVHGISISIGSMEGSLYETSALLAASRRSWQGGWGELSTGERHVPSSAMAIFFPPFAVRV